MPEYLSPGVYIEEIEIGAKPIEGVSTSTAGFLGETERGTTSPKLVTSWMEYQRAFGSYFGADKYLPYAVDGFFRNGGKRCYIARIIKIGATTSSLTLRASDDSNALVLTANGEGSWGKNIAVTIKKDGANTFRLCAYYWSKMPEPLFDPNENPRAGPAPQHFEIYDNVSIDKNSPNYYEKKVNNISNLIRIDVNGPQKFPADILITPLMNGRDAPIQKEGSAKAHDQGQYNHIKLAGNASKDKIAYDNMKIEIDTGTGSPQQRKIKSYDPTQNLIEVDSAWTTIPNSTSHYKISIPDQVVLKDTVAKIGTGNPTRVIVLDDTASSIDDDFIGFQVEIIAGTGKGQIRDISAYNGANKTATLNSDWSTTPDELSKYRVFKLVELANGTSKGALTDTQITLDSTASPNNVDYLNKQIEITIGTGAGQVRTITNYDGTSKIATLDMTWVLKPDNTSQYRIVNFYVANEGSTKNFAKIINLGNNGSPNKDFYSGMKFKIVSGTSIGEEKTIINYNGSSKIAIVDSAWSTVPDATSKFEITDPSPVKLAGYAQDFASHIFLTSSAGSTNDVYNGMKLTIVSGNGSNQTVTIQTYDGTSFIATVDTPWKIIPDDTSKYEISNTTIIPNDYEGVKTGVKTGLAAFEDIDDISIIYAPNASDLALTQSIVNHCENLKDRFAVIDSKQSDPQPSKPNPGDTKYAAFYYPWINITDPLTGVLRLIPSGGHVCGIYARSDTERGVHKAPANEVVSGADSVEFIISKGRQETLNPKGVNCIRSFSGRGIRVWGARTMSSDPLWKYINVRRLFIFLEKSIERSTQWVVFEPNNEKLWARVKQTISQFLTTVWKNGALMGTTPEEAFFVKCDRTTMTQDDIDNGKLIVVIGVAPTKPAEFVIFRIAQWQGGSAATE